MLILFLVKVTGSIPVGSLIKKRRKFAYRERRNIWDVHWNVLFSYKKFLHCYIKLHPL